MRIFNQINKVGMASKGGGVAFEAVVRASEVARGAAKPVWS